MTCPQCTHDCDQGRGCPARLGRMAHVWCDSQARREAHARTTRLRRAAELALAALTGAALTVLALAIV